MITVDAVPCLMQGGNNPYVAPLVEHLATGRSADELRLLFRLGFMGSRGEAFNTWLDSHAALEEFSWAALMPDRVADALWSRGWRIPGQPVMPKDSAFLATTGLVPHFKHVRVSAVVYDLIPTLLPHLFPDQAPGYRAALRRRLLGTRSVVTISEATRRDLIRLVGYPEERIRVITPGAPTPMSVQPYRTATGRPFVCYLGSLAFNKNVDGLLRVFAECVHRHALDYEMVLCGRDFVGTEYWHMLCSTLGILDRVHFLGWTREEVKASVLAGATMLWTFSWYEGSGLPVLEAATHVTPVLASNRGALPEILANPEQEVDPDDEPGIVAKAAHALKNEPLRREWQQRGLERSRLFNWKASAESLREWLG